MEPIRLWIDLRFRWIETNTRKLSVEALERIEEMFAEAKDRSKEKPKKKKG